mgnify:FL=1
MPGSDTDAAGATKLAWRIRHAHTGTPVPACDRSLPATVSVGFTVREANHSAPAQTLLERASQALTPSKAASRNRVPMTTQRHHPPDRPSTCPLRTIPV